jgi:murein DD-endopeptidase MepM/ murein hydrolase activator NlpD
MRSVVEQFALRRLVRPALVVSFAAGTAACSSDISRWSSPFSSQQQASAPAQETTGSVNAAPVQRVESRPLTSNTSAAPRQLPGGGREITVAQGETIDSISLRYRVPAADIMHANGLPRSAVLYEGQRIVLPGRQAASAPTQIAPPAQRMAAAPRMTQSASRTAQPAPRGAAPATRTPAIGGAVAHVVAPGETLMSIAKQYRKSVREIVTANRMGYDAHIKIGDRLIIPGVSASNANAPAVSTPAVAAAPAPAPSPAAKPQAQPPKQQIAMAEPPQTARLAAPAEATKEAARDSTGSAPSFRWPVRGRVISGFGPIPNGQQNDGINLSVPEGTAVRAAEDGVVAYSGNELKGYGNLVLVRHSNGYVTAYAHASELMVKRGDQVKRGQVIAKSGQTGAVNAPQLHFEIRNGSTPVDPMKFLPGA